MLSLQGWGPIKTETETVALNLHDGHSESLRCPSMSRQDRYRRPDMMESNFTDPEM